MVIIPLEQKVKIILREIYTQRMKLLLFFTLISLFILFLAVIMPKKYTASSQILAENEDIIRPLLEGQAVTTQVVDELSIVKQLMFSQKIMESLVNNDDWGIDNFTPFSKAKLISKIKGRTKIKRKGNNLIVLYYTDKNPNRAFRTVERYSNLFIDASKDDKKQQALSAYQFINRQVNGYKKKLSVAEKNIEEFKRNHSEDTETSILLRIDALKMRIKETELNVQELRIRNTNINQQLTGETKISQAMLEKRVLKRHLKIMQTKLTELQIKYRDQYPDIIALKREMALIKVKLDLLPETPVVMDVGEGKNTPQLNQVYDNLRTEKSKNSTELLVMEARLITLQQSLKQEFKLIQGIQSEKSVLAELRRDYNVNQSLYEDLLKRRETARVSMSLEVEGHGLTFKIKEKPILPSTPSTIGFLQIGIIGMFLSVTLPLVLVILWIEFNPSLRFEQNLPEGLPVLASIPVFITPKQQRRVLIKNILLVLLFFSVLMAYAVVGFLKMKGLM